MGRRFIGSYTELKVTIQILLNKHKRWEMLCVINNPILWKFAELSMDKHIVGSKHVANVVLSNMFFLFLRKD